jgi:hypothetical protein
MAARAARPGTLCPPSALASAIKSAACAQAVNSRSIRPRTTSKDHAKRRRVASASKARFARAIWARTS